MAKYTSKEILGFMQGAPHIAKFLEKEIGSEKAYDKEVARAKKAYDKELARLKAEIGVGPDDNTVVIDENNKVAQKIGDRMEAIKAGYHRVYSPMRLHAEKMFDLFQSKEVVNKTILEGLIDASYNNKNHNIFNLDSAQWDNEAGAKALKKFTELMFNNDLKKFQYYQNCLEVNTFAGENLKDLLQRPLPMTRNPERKDREDLLRKIEALSEQLENADSILHVNSSEFKAMKASLESLNEALHENVSDDELGKHLETMQEASMNYIKAKGVGSQSTQLGKDRMEAALDICATASEYMDCFASKERIQEVLEYERNTVGKILSKDGILNYNLDLEIETPAMNLFDEDEVKDKQEETLDPSEKARKMKEAFEIKQFGTVLSKKEEIKTEQEATVEVKETPSDEEKKEEKEVSQTQQESKQKADTTETQSQKEERENDERMRQMRVEWASYKLKLDANYLGNPKKIQAYLDNHPELEEEVKEHLELRRDSNEKIRNLEKNRNLAQKERPACTISEDGTILLAKKKDLVKQTTGNGCWSCVLSDMLLHFGVELTQRDIRFYRPKFHTDMLNNTETQNMIKRLSQDRPNEIFDVADLIHRTVPNVALHHMSIDTTIPDNKDFLLKKFEDILVNKNSPVALLIKGHYREIVGLKDNKVILQDTAEKRKDQYYYVSINELFRQCSGGQMVIDWLEDLKFTKDGQCKNVTEETKNYGFDCTDGEFGPSTATKYCSHVKGNEYSNYSLITQGIEEVVYVPKMAFEKEMGMDYAVSNEDIDLTSENEKEDILQNEPEKEVVVEPEEKFSKKEILNDSSLLAKDPQMLAFAGAVEHLGFNKNSMGCYDEWDKDMQSKIPMDMLLNDFDLGYSEEELREMPARNLYQLLDNQMDTYAYAEALRKIEENELEMENEDELGL